MRERALSACAVEKALMGATRCEWQADEETWRTTGPSPQGELTIAVVVDDGVLVVTVF